jgi:hypothetical protein
LTFLFCRAYLDFAEEDGVHLRRNLVEILSAIAQQLEKGVSSLRLMGDLDEPKLKSAAKLFECVSRPSAGGPVNTDAEVNAACKRVLSLMQEPLLPSTHPMPRSVTNGCGSPATNGDGGAGPTLLQSLTDRDDGDEGGNGADKIGSTSISKGADSIGSTSNGGDIGSRIVSEIINAVAKIFVSDSRALGRLSSDEAPPPLPASSDSDDEEPPPLTGLHFTC